MQPLISIIIPCFNAERWIAQSVSSCLEQTESRVEVVAVDDGSTDATLAILKSLEADAFGRVRVYTQRHLGICAARNYGSTQARAEFCLYLDADDLLTRDAAQKVLEGLSSGGWDAVVGDWVDFQDGNRGEKRVSAAFAHPSDVIASLLKHPPVCSCVAIRRNTHPWYESRVPWEVFDYFLTLAASGFSMKYIPHVIARIRQHDNPGRLSIVTNHFDPLRKGELYVAFKKKLKERDLLTSLRERVLDQEIVSNAYSLCRADKGSDAMTLVRSINPAHLRSYDQYKRFGLYDIMERFGPERGMKWFSRANQWLRRA